MSFIDKVVSAVTPTESADTRRQARERARSVAQPGGWLELVLEHHVEIEEAFAAVHDADDADERLDELKELSLVLTGHSNAEESVLYPALAIADEKGHAKTAYSEQAAVKMQMALLEDLPPMSEAFLEKLEHIRVAVAHHMAEEEGTWFLDLTSRQTNQARLTARYIEEFERYAGGGESMDDEDADMDAPTADLLPVR